jgi:hypothetical protein
MNHRKPHGFKASSPDSTPALAERRALQDGIPDYVVQLSERGGHGPMRTTPRLLTHT